MECEAWSMGVFKTSRDLCLAVADPDILPKFQVDHGAIKFVLSGGMPLHPKRHSSLGMPTHAHSH
eukprot:6173466-Pleurochrysis_carterae.AAC.3